MTDQLHRVSLYRQTFVWIGWALILRVHKQKLVFCSFSSLHKYSFSYFCASIESPQIHNSFLKADYFDLEFLMLCSRTIFFSFKVNNIG